MTDLDDFKKTDLVDDVLAAHVNKLQAASMQSGFGNFETLTATRELVDNDTAYQVFTLAAAAQDVELPALNTAANHIFLIMNDASSSYAATVKTFSGAATVATLAAGEASLFVADDGTWAQVGVDTTLDTFRNLLINGDMQVAQRGTSFGSTTTPANSDDTYLLDRTVLLSDGNNIVDVTQSTDAPTGFNNSIKLEVETANKQFGILKIVEGKNCTNAIGTAKASLSFYAKMAAADDNTHSLKAVVLAWDSTVDTVTSDVVSSWGATITPVANWTAENTAGSNTLTTSWQRFTIEDIDVDTASAVNLAVFIYCDQTDGAIDDAVFISGIQLEAGTSTTDFEHLPYDASLARCQRYYYQVLVQGAVSIETLGGTGSYNSASYTHPCQMRAVPSITVTGTFTKVNAGNPTIYYSTVGSFVIGTTATGVIPVRVSVISDASSGVTVSAEL